MKNIILNILRAEFEKEFIKETGSKDQVSKDRHLYTLLLLSKIIKRIESIWYTLYQLVYLYFYFLVRFFMLCLSIDTKR